MRMEMADDKAAFLSFSYNSQKGSCSFTRMWGRRPHLAHCWLALSEKLIFCFLFHHKVGNLPDLTSPLGAHRGLINL